MYSFARRALESAWQVFQAFLLYEFLRDYFGGLT